MDLDVEASGVGRRSVPEPAVTAHPRTKIMDFGGSDPSRVLIFRNGIPKPTGNLPEMLGQPILVGIISVTA